MTDIEKRAAAVFDIRVKHAAFDKAFQGIQGAVTLSKYTPIVQCVLLVGGPGTGKTTLSRQLLVTYRETNEQSIAYVTARVGAIYVEIPSPVTVDGIATVILMALKDPFPESGTPLQKAMRIANLVNDIGTKLIILDEFHNLFHLKSKKDVKEVRDWLRGLINNMRATLVLAGIPECTTLIRGDLQLSDRFTHRFSLSDIPLVHERAGTFQKYLGQFSADVITFTGVMSCPTFDNKHDALRMLAVTAANPRAITHMYMFSLLRAFKDPHFNGHITLDHFSESAENSYFEERRLITANPFQLDDTSLIQQLAGRF